MRSSRQRKTLYARSVRRTHEPAASTLGVLVGLCALSLIAAPVEKAARKQPEIQPRKLWTTSRVVGSPDPPALYQAERVFPHLRLEQPVFLTPVPGTSRLLVLQRQGPIVTFEGDPDVAKADLFLDIKRQLNGIAFHPRFQENGYVYVYSIDRPERQMNCVRRFTVNQHNPPRCDPSSERILIEWKSSGHSEGSVEFGLDDYLYVATGDGRANASPELSPGGSRRSGGRQRLDSLLSRSRRGTWYPRRAIRAAPDTILFLNGPLWVCVHH